VHAETDVDQIPGLQQPTCAAIDVDDTFRPYQRAVTLPAAVRANKALAKSTRVTTVCCPVWCPGVALPSAGRRYAAALLTGTCCASASRHALRVSTNLAGLVVVIDAVVTERSGERPHCGPSTFIDWAERIMTEFEKREVRRWCRSRKPRTKTQTYSTKVRNGRYFTGGCIRATRRRSCPPDGLQRGSQGSLAYKGLTLGPQNDCVRRTRTGTDILTWLTLSVTSKLESSCPPSTCIVVILLAILSLEPTRTKSLE
jgi:hypothetical protein